MTAEPHLAATTAVSGSSVFIHANAFATGAFPGVTRSISVAAKVARLACSPAGFQASQTLISPSSRIAPTRRVPHGEKVSPLVPRESDFCCSITRWISSALPLYKVVSKCFVVENEKSCSPRLTSQRRTRPSHEAVTKFLPFGWNTAVALIVSIFPLST